VDQHKVKCPACKSTVLKVVCTKRTENGVIVRRRVCVLCNHRWYSIQYPEVPVYKSEIKWIKTGTTVKYVPSKV